MKLRHSKILVNPTLGLHNFESRVTALSYTQNSSHLAVATADRVISIYNEQGKQVDRFNTKSNSGGPKDYVVRYVDDGDRGRIGSID